MPYLAPMFLKLSAKPSVYDITTYLMVGFGLETVALSVLVFKLLLACELLVLSPGCGCWSMLPVGLLLVS